MQPRPSSAHSACLPTNAYGDPSVSFAITAEVENTITSPNSTSRKTVPNSHLSTPTRFAIQASLHRDGVISLARLQLAHHFLERAPTMLEIVELVEAGARRRQQHHVARNCVFGSRSHRRIQGA